MLGDVSFHLEIGLVLTPGFLAILRTKQEEKRVGEKIAFLI